MDPAKAQADDIFCDALELASPAERSAYLGQACADDPELRQRVERLLAAHAEANSFLDAAPVVAATTCELTTVRPGPLIGPYKLLEQIGEGGFGVVFMAEQQEPIRRKVALKLLKPGMDTKQVIARFEAERQALALMDHPNIAKVLDAGQTSSGRPYFVMDLVKGLPITEYCDQGQLTTRERLKLFIHVCQAVQHAHQKGIIHRDLKPSNMLVTLQDGVPLAKVIDFGIAKAIGQQLTDKTLFTGFAQLIGSPLYMSPEQAALSNVDVDTRSDVYSVGVVFYELLTGTTPFDKERFQGSSYDEMRRIIREEEPPRPSARISTLGQAATTISEQRKTDARRLRQLFRGELDWIVMKCLEKDRNRRYESASALAADVQRYLDDEPVQACPPSVWYRCRKFARRNKVVLAITGCVLAALTLGAGLATWQWRVAEMRRTQSEQAGTEARKQADIAKAINQFFIRDLLAAASAEEDRGRKRTVEEVLDQAAQKIEGAFSDQPEVEATVRLAIGTTYVSLALHPKAERHLRRALEIRQRVLGEEQPETLEAMIQMAELLDGWPRFAEGEPLVRKGLETARRVLGEEHPTTLYFLGELGYVACSQGRFSEGDQLLRQALDGKLRVLGPEQFSTLETMRNLIDPVMAQGQYTEAERIARECLDITERVFPENHPFFMSARGALANILAMEGKAIELEPLARRNLEQSIRVRPNSRWRWDDQLRVAQALYLLGKFDEAEGQSREVMQNLVHIFRPDHEPTAGTATVIAKCLELQGLVSRSTGRWEQAEAMLREALKRRGARETAAALFDRSCLGTVLEASARRTEAATFLRAALDRRRELMPSSPDLAESLLLWGEYLLERNEVRQAEAALREALVIERQTMPPRHRNIGQTLAALGWVLTRLDRAKEAEPLLREGLDICRTGYPLGNWTTTDAETPRLDWAAATAESRLGGCLTGLGQFAEAEKLLLGSYQTLQDARGTPPQRRSEAADRIVKLYETWGKADKAAQWRARRSGQSKPPEKGAAGRRAK